MRSISTRIPLVLAAALCVLAPTARESRATTITILNADPPFMGFNDSTAAAPVGGNPGTTVGAQRFNAVQRAADIWGSILDSKVQIRVQASWGSLTCSPTSGFLGFAGPVGALSDFAGAPHPNTWYAIAQANALSGMDLDPNNVDITATFNSEVGTSNCLSIYSWYYGLDNNSGSREFDLVTAAMHEIAHGLGFVNFVDESTGHPLGGQIDVYSRWVFDNTAGKRWDEMTDAERIASAVNTGNLVWDGPEVTRAAPGRLGDRPIMEVHTPPSIAGIYTTLPAQFGAPFTVAGVTNDVVLVDDGVGTPSDACDPIVNGAQLAGKIALIDRGGCPFAFKVKAVQDAGAIGAIVVNNVPGHVVVTMAGTDPTITIPASMISLEDGNAFKTALPSGVNVTMRLDPAHMAGADDAGKVLLYAPDVLVPASSVIHWDDPATPDLLMERDIPSGIPQDGDLTVQAFRDMDWPLIVPISVEYLNALSMERGIVLTWGLGSEALGRFTGVGVERSTEEAGPYALRTPELLSPSQEMSYEDLDVEFGASYWYRLLLRTPSGSLEASRPVRASFSGTSIRTALAIPLQVHAGEPLEIRYQLGAPCADVRIEFYDVSGRRMRTLSQGPRGRGAYRAAWDGFDAAGHQIARGIYFVRLVAGTATVSKKAVFVRP